MPFATNGMISQAPIDGGLEITSEQYGTALTGLLEGKQVSIDNGFEVSFPVEAEPPVLPEPSPEEVKADFKSGIQTFMDERARAAGYENLLTAISYADEPSVLKFQNEGKAFRTWRSLVWEFANEKLELVFSGAGDQPNLQALLAALPALDLPE